MCAREVARLEEEQYKKHINIKIQIYNSNELFARLPCFVHFMVFFFCVFGSSLLPLFSLLFLSSSCTLRWPNYMHWKMCCALLFSYLFFLFSAEAFVWWFLPSLLLHHFHLLHCTCCDKKNVVLVPSIYKKERGREKRHEIHLVRLFNFVLSSDALRSISRGT